MSVIFGAKQSEELVRHMSEVNLDKSDLQRLTDFVSEKPYDLLLIGGAKRGGPSSSRESRGTEGCLGLRGRRRGWGCQIQLNQ